MDVILQAEAQGGQESFLNPIGEVQSLELGDEDEDVDIDDEDTIAVPSHEIESRTGTLQGRARTGISGSDVGVGETRVEEANPTTSAPDLLGGLENGLSGVDGDIQIEVVTEIPRIQFQKRSGHHAAESQASIGLSHQFLHVSVEDVGGGDNDVVEPLGNGQEFVPEAELEGNVSSKRQSARGFRKHLSVKSGNVRGVPSQSRGSVGLSHSHSKEASVDKSDGDGAASCEHDVQTSSKRKTMDVEPSTSTRVKLGKLNADFIPWSVMSPQKMKTEEMKVKVVPMERKIESPSKRKERLKDRGSVGLEKTQKVAGKEREKHTRRMIIDDDDEEEDNLPLREIQEATGKGKYIGVTSPPEVSVGRKGSTVDNVNAKKGSESQVLKEEQQPSAGENVGLQSMFGIRAKKKSASQVVSDKKSDAIADSLAQDADESTPFKWITCTKCKKPRKVPPDAKIRKKSWHCEENKWDLKHSSCSVPQECAVEEEVMMSEEVSVSVREPQPEVSFKNDENEGSQNAQTRLNLVWLKVDEEDFWWPGKLVTEAEVPPNFHAKLSLSEGGKKIVVALFHPAKDVEPYQVVRRSILRPFQQFIERFRNINTHPNFKLAFNEAYSLYRQSSAISQPSVNGSSVQHDTDTSKRLKFIVTENVEQNIQDATNEEAQSNEFEVEYGQIREEVSEDVQPPAEISLEGEGVAVHAVEDIVVSKDSSELIGGSGASERREETLNGAMGEKEDFVEVFMETKNLDDKNVNGKTKVWEASPIEEYSASMEKRVIDIEISPTKRLTAYDPFSFELHFQDGIVVKIDPENLGRVFHKNTSGLTLHKCIYEVGRDNVRKRFPKHAKSSSGLKFGALDQTSDFAERLRATWAREYRDEVMPKLLKTRFVAGCIMEERGEPVNWAAELTHDIFAELKGVLNKIRPELSPYVQKSITFLLETPQESNQGHEACIVPREVGAPNGGEVAVPRVSGIVQREETVDLTEFNHAICQQCTGGGELLSCDGRDCRKSYHLTCLDPPLHAVPTTAFFCPSCSVKALQSAPAELEIITANDVVDKEKQGDVSREEPESALEIPTLVQSIGPLDSSVVVDTGTSVGDDVSKGVLLEHAHVDILANVSPSTLDVDCSIPKLAEEGYPTSQIGGPEEPLLSHPKEQLISLPKDSLVSEGSERPQARVIVPGCNRAEIPTKSRSTEYVVTTKQTVTNDQEVGLSPYNPSRVGGENFSSIQLVNRDERSGSRGETSLLPGFTDGGLQSAQTVVDVELELEEGEIDPHSQDKNSLPFNDQSTSVEQLPRSLILMGPLQMPPRVQLPNEDGEFPSSDDHNSVCEGCEVGGELMLCDGKGCKVVYHKECLDPPLCAIPAGEWYCPQCELKRKGCTVEKIWAVTEAGSGITANGVTNLKRRVDNVNSNTSSSEYIQGDQCDSDEEDMPLSARFKRTSQAPQAEVEGGDNEVLEGSAIAAGVMFESTNMKDDGSEYLVQWKSHSHAHNKWVAEKELAKMAPKELARFKKMSASGQVAKWNSEWAQPERVIQRRLINGLAQQSDAGHGKDLAPSIQLSGVEWYVKWRGLGYEHCTWEPVNAGVLATTRASKLFRAYEQWEQAAKQRATQESQEEAEKLTKAPIKILETQPESMVRGELVPMQLDALNQLRSWWHARKNGILVYEASQEKIVTTIIFFLSLVEEFRVVHPILVVVPISLIQNWELELHLWAPKLNIVNYASKMEEARDVVRRTEFNSFSAPFKPQIVLTTFEVINCDMDHLKRLEWEALIIDEGRRQRPLKTYRPFSQIKSVFRLLLLSEPLKSNVEELSQLVCFLDPRKSLLVHGDESTQVTELRRRLSGRVQEYIPINRLTEYWVPVEMTSVHLKQYYDILVKHYPTLSRNRREHQIQDVVTKLRQSCNHPFLADPTLEGAMGQGCTGKELLDAHIEISGKMQLVHMMMPILKSKGWRVLIFSQEAKQLDILERYMTQSHGTDSYERVDSDLAVKAKEAAIQRFNAEGSKRFVLLLKTGIHISFKDVQVVILYDSDWNPANDMRALHKIHNEGDAGSKPLPVLRLYTHLSVEESTLILYRDKQMPQTRASVSAKVCQKLLTWGASKIFELHDKDASGQGVPQRPKGGKICPKARTRRVVYDPENVQKLLEIALSQEECMRLAGDELLEAILVPRDEAAPLFAESDHPINMVAGESAEAFWASFLKWRHEEWQKKEVNMLGKGQRGRKRVTYDEDAMASAAYTKAQMADESERKRTKRRKSSSEEEQEVPDREEIPSAPVSILQCPLVQPRTTPMSSHVPASAAVLPTSPGVSHIDTQLIIMDTVIPSTGTSRDAIHVGTDAIQSEPTKVFNSGDETVESGNHHLNEIGHSHVVREVRGNVVQAITLAVPPTNPAVGTSGAAEVEMAKLPRLDLLKEVSYSTQIVETLIRICSFLKLPELVKERVHELFKHILQTSKNLRKRRPKHEIIAIELALVWLAADQLHHPIDKSTSIDKVEMAYKVHYDNRPQLEGALLKKVKELCSNFREPPLPSPPVVPPTTPQPASVPQPSTPTSSLSDVPPRKESQPPTINVPSQARTEHEVPNIVSDIQLPCVPEACVENKASMLAPVSSSSPLPSVQVVLATETQGEAPQATEPPQSENVVELVEADPCMVVERPLDSLLTQNMISTFPAPGTLTSGYSALEQGLGWVIQGVIPQVRTREEVEHAVLEVVTPAVELMTPGQVLEVGAASEGGTPQVHLDLRQIHQAELMSPTAADFGAESSQPPTPVVPLTHTQVLLTEDVPPNRPSEQVATDTLPLPSRLREDRNFIIHGQMKEIEAYKQRFDQEEKDLKDQYAKACRNLRSIHSASDPFVQSQKELFDIDLRALTRRKSEENTEIKIRQRNDRDKLSELYRNLIDQSVGMDHILPEVSNVELEIRNLKKFYSKFLVSTPMQSPLQEPFGIRTSDGRESLPTQPGSLTSQALPSSRGHADGRTRVVHRMAGTRLGEVQQRQPVVRASTSTTSSVTSVSQQHQAYVVQSVPGQGISPAGSPRVSVVSSTTSPPTTSPQQQWVQSAYSALQSMQGQGVNPLADSQIPSMVASMVVPTVMPQSYVQPPPGQPQRSHPAAEITPSQNQQREAPPGTRSLSAFPSGVSTILPAAGSASRAPTMTAFTPPAPVASAQVQVYPDVLLKEKDKLNKELEKAKTTYESESQRIKAEYDREAEILHRKYEGLLVEEHRAFIRKQQKFQQNIIKVEWNRQLAEALKLREELASRAGVLAQSSTIAMPAPYFQPPQPHIPVRSMSGGTVMAPMVVTYPRDSMYSGNAGPPAGTSSIQVQSPVILNTRSPTPMNQQASRYVMPPIPHNEQARIPLSHTHAALTDSISWSTGFPVGSNGAGPSMVPLSREHSIQQPNISTYPTNIMMAANWSTQTPTTGTFHSVLGPVSVPSVPDPILSIIRNCVATESTSVPGEAAVATASPVVIPSSPQEIVPSSLSLLQQAEIQTVPSEQLAFSENVPQIPRADGRTAQSSVGASNAPAGVVSGAGPQRSIAGAPPCVRPTSVIYLSDSDED